MTRRDLELSLRQMQEHASEAIALARGRRRNDLDTDRTFNLALVRLLEVVGEAASRVSPEERVRLSRIPWPQIIGLRNRLIHGYDEVDHDILWEIVGQDLPNLIEELKRGGTISEDTAPS